MLSRSQLNRQGWHSNAGHHLPVESWSRSGPMGRVILRWRVRWMAVLESGSIVRNKQGQDPCCNLPQHLRRSTLNQLRLPGTPVKALQLICKNDPVHPTTLWQDHLKWITFDSRGHRTEQSQANLGVVGLRGYHQSWSPSSLLTTNLRCEFKPHQISSIRHVCDWH